jgi:hypothetical protein
MNIAALSSGLSQINLQQQVGVSVENLAMNASKKQGNQLVDLINTSIPRPTLGNRIDIKA